MLSLRYAVGGYEPLRGSSKGLAQETHSAQRRIDYACWDLYAHVSQWYETDPTQKEARKQIRMDTLHALEQGGNEISEIAELVSTAIVHRHLETMERLGIQYDFLPRESEVLRLHFWDAAFALMKEKDVLYREKAGKNKDCWVMRRAGTEGVTGDGPDEEAKVIVRSNGTVTYVGKDIAYHLWKFGKLGLDFGIKVFHHLRRWQRMQHLLPARSRQGEPRPIALWQSRCSLQRYRLAPERSAKQRD